jgi:hypothetical protein
MPKVIVLVKNYSYSKNTAFLSFYLDEKSKEVDVFVEENGYIHPLEIKKSANPDKREVRKFDVIEKTTLMKGNGGIVCMMPSPFPIDESNTFIPSNLI